MILLFFWCVKTPSIRCEHGHKLNKSSVELLWEVDLRVKRINTEIIKKNMCGDHLLNKQKASDLLESAFAALLSFVFSSSFISARGWRAKKLSTEVSLHHSRIIPVSLLSTLTSFLLLSFLLVFVNSGPFCSLLVIGHVLPASLPLILRVRELLIASYSLISGADCNYTTQKSSGQQSYN